MGKDILTWDLEAMSNCRENIDECCRFLMNASDVINKIDSPSGELDYNTTKETIKNSIQEIGQTFLNIRNALLRNELDLENAEKANERIINEMLDKFFYEGMSIEEIFEYLENGDKYFRDDITYDIGIREFGPWGIGLVKPSSANDGEAKPLIIMLPGLEGHGLSDNDLIKVATEGMTRNTEFEKFDGYVACMPIDSANIKLLKGVIDDLSKECNIDKSNIIIAGYSSGAKYAISLLRDTDIFSQAILVSTRRWNRTDST